MGGVHFNQIGKHLLNWRERVGKRSMRLPDVQTRINKFLFKKCEKFTPFFLFAIFRVCKKCVLLSYFLVRQGFLMS